MKAQFYKRGTGTYLTLYIQAAPDHWYYFNYEFTNQSMTIYGSSGEWVDMIKALPADKRVITGKSDMGSFKYRVGSSRTEVPNFLMRMDGQNPAQGNEDDGEDDSSED